MHGDSSSVQRLQEMQTVPRRHTPASPRSPPCLPSQQPPLSPQQLRLLLLSRQESLRRNLSASCLPSPSLPPTSLPTSVPASVSFAQGGEGPGIPGVRREAKGKPGEAQTQPDTPHASGSGQPSPAAGASSVSSGSRPGSGVTGTVPGLGDAGSNDVSLSPQALLQLLLQQQMRVKHEGKPPVSFASETSTPSATASSSNMRASSPLSSPSQTHLPRLSGPLRNAQLSPALAAAPLASVVPGAPLEGPPVSGAATAVVEPDPAKQLRLLLQVLHGNAAWGGTACGPRGLPAAVTSSSRPPGSPAGPLDASCASSLPSPSPVTSAPSAQPASPPISSPSSPPSSCLVSGRQPSWGTANEAVLAQLCRLALLSQTQGQSHGCLSPLLSGARRPASPGVAHPSSPPSSYSPGTLGPHSAPSSSSSSLPASFLPPQPLPEATPVRPPASPGLPSLSSQQLTVARLLLESLRGRGGEGGASGTPLVSALLHQLAREKPSASSLSAAASRSSTPSLAVAPGLFFSCPAWRPPAPPPAGVGTPADALTQRVLASLASLQSGGGTATKEASPASPPLRSTAASSHAGPVDPRRLLSLPVGLPNAREHPPSASREASLPSGSSPAVAASLLLGGHAGETAALIAAAFAQQTRLMLDQQSGRDTDRGGKKNAANARQERKEESSQSRKKAADKTNLAALSLGGARAPAGLGAATGLGPVQRSRKEEREEARGAEEEKGKKEKEGGAKSSRSLSLPPSLRGRTARGRGRPALVRAPSSPPSGRRQEFSGKSEGGDKTEAGSEQAGRQSQGGAGNSKPGRRSAAVPPVPLHATPDPKGGSKRKRRGPTETGAGLEPTLLRRGSGVSYVERHPRSAGSSCLDEDEEEEPPAALSSRPKDGVAPNASSARGSRSSSPSSAAGKAPAQPAGAAEPTDDESSDASSEGEEDRETPVFLEGTPMTDEEQQLAADQVNNIPALTLSELVRAAVLPLRIEGFHALEEAQLLYGRKDWLRYECPLCDRQAHTPDAYWANFEHYLKCHWRKRHRLGGYVCFPCRRHHDLSPRAGGSTSSSSESTSSAPPSPSASQGSSKGKVSPGGPRRGPKFHFHCPLCPGVFGKFASLQRHALCAHPVSAADPRLHLAPQQLHTPWMREEEDYSVALRPGEEREERGESDGKGENVEGARLEECASEAGEEERTKVEAKAKEPGDGDEDIQGENKVNPNGDLHGPSDVTDEGGKDACANVGESETNPAVEDALSLLSPSHVSSPSEETKVNSESVSASPLSSRGDAEQSAEGTKSEEGKQDSGEGGSWPADPQATVSSVCKGETLVKEEPTADEKEQEAREVSEASQGDKRDTLSARRVPLRSCLVVRSNWAKAAKEEGKEVTAEKPDPAAAAGEAGEAERERAESKREDREKDETRDSPDKSEARKVKKKVAFVPQVRVRPLDKELSIMEKLGAVMGPVLTGVIASSTPATGTTEGDEGSPGETPQADTASKEGDSCSGASAPQDLTRRGTRSATVAAMAAERERVAPSSPPAADASSVQSVNLPRGEAVSSPRGEAVSSSLSSRGRERGRAVPAAAAGPSRRAAAGYGAGAGAEEESLSEEKEDASRAPSGQRGARGGGSVGRGGGGPDASVESREEDPSAVTQEKRRNGTPGGTEETEGLSGNPTRGSGRGRSSPSSMTASPDHRLEKSSTSATESPPQSGKDASCDEPAAPSNRAVGRASGAAKSEGDSSPASPVSLSPASPSSLDEGPGKEDDLPPWKKRKRTLVFLPTCSPAPSPASPPSLGDAAAVAALSVVSPSSRDRRQSPPSSPRSSSPPSRRVSVSIAAAAAAAARARRLAAARGEAGEASQASAKRRQGGEAAYEPGGADLEAKAALANAGVLPVGQRRTSPRCSTNNAVSPAAAPAARDSRDGFAKTGGKTGALQVPEETSPTSGERRGRASGQVSPVGLRSRSGSPSPQRASPLERRGVGRVEDRETERSEKEGDGEQRGKRREEKTKDSDREGNGARSTEKPKTKTPSPSGSASDSLSLDSKKEASEQQKVSQKRPVVDGKRKKKGKKEGGKTGHKKKDAVGSLSRTTLKGQGGQNKNLRHMVRANRRHSRLSSSPLLMLSPLRTRERAKSPKDSCRPSSPVASSRTRRSAESTVSPCAPAVLSTALGSIVCSSDAETPIADALGSSGRRRPDRVGTPQEQGGGFRLCLASDLLDASPLSVRRRQNLSLQRLPSQPPVGAMCASRPRKRRFVSSRSEKDTNKPFAGEGTGEAKRAPFAEKLAPKRQKRATLDHPRVAHAPPAKDEEKEENGVRLGDTGEDSSRKTGDGSSRDASPRRRFSTPASPLVMSPCSDSAEAREDCDRGGGARAEREEEKAKEIGKQPHGVPRRSADTWLSAGGLNAALDLSRGRRNSLGNDEDRDADRHKRAREDKTNLASVPALRVRLLRSPLGKTEREKEKEENGVGEREEKEGKEGPNEKNEEIDGKDGNLERRGARTKLFTPSTTMPRRASC
ncbi:hypothetical protein TGVAND_228670 [Toxoplasma gondii VAND]|uniref:C2H2-type domain-containing protein n=1 Tax=Toxoplasma gondii VAND TaxID=933077 RepID=A0A086QJM0_TOXGO|nr:hypothetical protein TGVAND_228670 [Toxoplasma gondii VAND]